MISRHSIRAKLTTSVAVVVTLLGLGFVSAASCWFSRLQQAELEAFAIHETDEAASIVAALTEIGPEHAAALGRLIPERNVISVGVWSLAGELVQAVPADGASMTPWPEGFARALRGETAIDEPVRVGGPRELRAARLVRFERQPRWIVTSTVSRADADEALSTFRAYATLAFAGAAALIVWGSYVLLSRALAPFAEVARRTVALAGPSESGLLTEPPPDTELSELTSLLNGMLEEMRTTHARLARFSSNVSHELRTPLTRIRGEIEAALASDDAKRRETALASTLEEIDVLGRVIQALLDLARDGGELLVGLPLVDVCEIAAEVTEEADSLARDRCVHVVLAESATARVRGSRPLLARVLWNLVDNAIRAARHRVEVRVRDLSNGLLWIDVEDDGPGLEANGEPEELFEAFVRGRRETSDGAGHGLGLALSRSIARRHGGDLVWGRSVTLGGASLRLVLPSAGGWPKPDSPEALPCGGRTREEGRSPWGPHRI